MIEFKKFTHYAKELEQAILGACLLEKTAFSRIYGLINDDTFYFAEHKEVFGAMREMFEGNAPIDSYTVVEWLTNKRPMDNAFLTVTNLTMHVVSTANLEYHSYLIKEMWQRRRVIEIKYKAIEDLDPHKNVIDINTELNNILGNKVKRDWYDMTEVMFNVYKHQEKIKQTGGIGLQTGIKTIDKENGGFFSDQMIIIGARPSVGKSALAGSMALNMARTGKKVGIVSLEMSNEEIGARIAAIDTQTDFSVLYRGLYRDSKEAEFVYNRIAQSTSRLPIFISDKTEVNALEIKAKAMKLKATQGLDCLFIDYLQLISTDERASTREREISKISRSCKIMAKEMEIPVILLCQLNREVTKRKGQDRYPQLSDLRESGSLEQDADIVMFLHSDWLSGHPVNDDGGTTEGQADLVVRKWRNGKANFTIPLDFNGPQMNFKERGTYGFRALKVVEDENPF